MSILSKIEEIETKYHFNDITFNNVQLWPYLRVYLSYSIFGKEKTNANKKVIGNAVKNLFYGFSNYFKKVDYIIFSNTEQRKLINNKYYDRFDFLPDNYKKNLFFELTTNSFYKRNQIPTKNIVSKIPLYFLSKVIERFVSLNSIKNKEIIDTIIKDNNFELDVDSLLRNYISHYKVAKLLIKIYKPKALVLITSYTNYPYIHAFKEKGVKVIEFQHGLINENHLAYNFKSNSDRKMFPDYLFTFGEFEKEIFNKNNNFIQKDNVLPIGHFYIDLLKKNFIKNIDLSNKLSKYKCSVAVTLQPTYEKKLIDFIESIAAIYSDIAFVIVPREKSELTFQNNNVITYSVLNCYEIILNCDIHSTIYSSCAVEAIGLNKPNILINIDNKSMEHLGFILLEEKNKVVNTIDDFIKASKELDVIKFKKTLKNKFFNNNFVQNMDKSFKIALVK